MTKIKAEDIAISEMMQDHRTVVEILASHEVEGIKFHAALQIRIAGFTDDGEWFSLPDEDVEIKKALYRTFVRNDVVKQISRHMAAA